LVARLRAGARPRDLAEIVGCHLSTLYNLMQAEGVTPRTRVIPPRHVTTFAREDAATWDEAPRLCPACRGASLIRVELGLACRLCAKQVYVREALQALAKASRPLHGANC
jgi:hypothetical protein